MTATRIRVGGAQPYDVVVGRGITAELPALVGDGAATNAALTGGFQWAIWVCGTIALLALPTIALLFARRGRRPLEAHVPAMEADGGS